MDKLAEIIGVSMSGLAFMAAFIFFGSVFGAALGALSGELVSWIFDDTLKMILAKVGVTGVEIWQAGCFMGFFGGFLKTRVHSGKS